MMYWYKTSGARDIDFSSLSAFIDSLRRLSPDQLGQMQQQFDRLKDKSRPGPEWVTLYHGAPSTTASKIRDEGLSKGKGQRSHGFLGSTYEVDNQGVFLTDNKAVASYFGSNRSDHPADYEVLTFYVDTSGVMDASAAPRDVVRMGLRLVNDYEGTRKTRLALRDWWWLLDQPAFVNAIKRAGYSGVRFLESTPGLSGKSNTYLMFNPSTNVKTAQEMGVIRNVGDYYRWLVDNGTQNDHASHEQELK